MSHKKKRSVEVQGKTYSVIYTIEEGRVILCSVFDVREMLYRLTDSEAEAIINAIYDEDAMDTQIALEAYYDEIAP